MIPDRSLWEHLSRALPSEMIFDRLRTISSDRLFSRYSTELILNTLEIIVKWLQGLGSERPSDLYDRFRGELLRYKVEVRYSRLTSYATYVINIIRNIFI